MCGIAGWVDFDRDVTAEPAAAMAATMACRGPDDEGLWTAPHVAFGHRRLAVIDPEGGRQPMAVAGLAALTYSGETYNYRELREELAAKGHRFRTRSDTEVVLRAYLEWGEDFVDRLNGMYAFALWDARTEELLLVRDRLGIKPLYYYPLRDGVLFGSEPKAILAHPLAEPAVRLDGLRELLALVKTPEHAVFEGMYELRPGHLLRVRRGGLTKRRYWSLPVLEHADDLDTTVGTVRELLDDIVTRQLVSDVPLCALLSGGLDSSAITALARERGDVRSFAVDFAGYRENFRPNDVRDTPDAPFVRELAEHVNSDHTDIVLDTGGLADPDMRSVVVRAHDLPSPLGDLNTSLYLLFRAIRSRSTVALSGESADEVFGGYPWFHLPEAVHAETFPWLALILRHRDPADLFDRDLRERLDLTAYRADRYRQALAEVPYRPGDDGTERRMRELCYLNLTRWLQLLLDRKDRLSMAVGLEVRVPFCDHRLVEYVFNTPWAMKTFDGREKSLLRAAVADVLPASILDRRKSPYPATQDPGYDRAIRAELGALVRDGAPVAPLLDRDKVRQVAGTPGRLMIEMVLSLNVWLATYRPRLDV